MDKPWSNFFRHPVWWYLEVAFLETSSLGASVEYNPAAISRACFLIADRRSSRRAKRLKEEEQTFVSGRASLPYSPKLDNISAALVGQVASK